MNVAPLFHKIRETTEKFVILQGGGDSAKTVSALQTLAVAATQVREIITVTAQDTPNLRGGALRSFENYVASDPDIYPHIQSYHKTNLLYTFKNKSIIEFKGFEDEQTARGSERTRLFMNEVNSRTYNLFWQLQRKTRKQVIMDYNPSAPFWVHAKLLPSGSEFEKQFTGKVKRWIVDHRHNPFLTPEEHEAYESISDPELFRVYARGLTGKVTGLIFGHFKKLDYVPEGHLRVIWAIDYGYTTDPTAITKIYLYGGKRAHFVECCYAPGLGAEQIKAILLQNGYAAGEVLYSEADPNMVNQLRLLALPVQPAIKGPGSLVASIGKVREYECTYQGTNFEKEVNTWSWMKAQDLLTGKEILTNVPVDAWDHLCAAARYGIYTDSFRTRTG